MKKPELAWLKDLGEKLRPLAHRYRAVLIVLLAGMLLLASGGWFGGGEEQAAAQTGQPETAGFDLAVFEQDLNEKLAAIEGVGRVELMLSLDQTEVTVKSLLPTFRGAVVLCDGADNAQVRLAVTQAVGTVCGIGSDKVTVLKMAAGT